MEKKNTWETYSNERLQEVDKFADEYRDFLDKGKTERECVDYIVNTAEKAGYRELQTVIKKGEKLKKGDKVYAVWMNKSVVMFRIGEKPMAENEHFRSAH